MAVSGYIHHLRAKIGPDLLLMPGVAAVIIDPASRVLLQRRSDDGKWGLPGGGIEPGEEPADALVREIREETALDIVPERIVGVYSGPDFRIRYPNGDETMIVSPDALPPMERRHHLRIEDALRHDPRARFRATPSADPPRFA